MVKLGYTIVYVASVEESLTFYESAFGFERKFITPEGDYGELETGSTRLSFGNYDLARANFSDNWSALDLEKKAVGIELAMVCDDPQKVLQTCIRLGASLVTDIQQKPWGQLVGYVRDPNGLLLEICSEIKQ